MAEQYFKALKIYFKLKEDYDRKLNKRKYAILSDDEYSAHKKRAKIQSIKIPCIGCKRPVRTIFSNADRKYSAVCGDRTKPCKLHISLQKGEIINLKEGIRDFKSELNDIENDIITTKLDLLFSFIDEEDMIESFEELKHKHEEETKLLNLFKNELRLNYNTDERNDLIKRLQNENTILLSQHKDLLKEYFTTENVGTLKELTEMYIHQIKPKFDEILTNKYPFQSVEPCFDDNNKKCLIQKDGLLELDEYIIEDPEILAFVLR